MAFWSARSSTRNSTGSPPTSTIQSSRNGQFKRFGGGLGREIAGIPRVNGLLECAVFHAQQHGESADFDNPPGYHVGAVSLLLWARSNFRRSEFKCNAKALRGAKYAISKDNNLSGRFSFSRGANCAPLRSIIATLPSA